MRVEDNHLEKNTILLRQEASDWKDAIRLATDLLEAVGAVTPEYYRGILKNIEQNGPYFVIMPAVAMPHAAPEYGVRENAFSLVTLKTPVHFGHLEHDPVEIILCIAAKDRQSLNEEVIVQIMDLLDFDETVNRLKAARDLEDVRRLFAALPAT